MTRREWLASEPFTLLLGAGFFGFFAHTGLLVALEEARLRPRVVIGVSAGALAGGLWASGVAAATLANELSGLRRADFWDPSWPLGGLLRGEKFASRLRSILGPTAVSNVEECPTPFRAVVHDVVRRCPEVVSRGPLDLAIRASCSVPFMFRPIWHQGRLWVDGGVSDRSGFTALAGADRVLFHGLASQRRFLRRRGPPTDLPRARGLTLVTPDLPRVTPFALERGREAIGATRRFAAAWLSETL